MEPGSRGTGQHVDEIGDEVKAVSGMDDPSKLSSGVKAQLNIEHVSGPFARDMGATHKIIECIMQDRGARLEASVSRLQPLQPTSSTPKMIHIHNTDSAQKFRKAFH